MSSQLPPDLCTFELEPEERYLPAARLFAGSVARAWGAAEADVADLRLGVTELVAASMAAGAERVSISMQRHEDGLQLAVKPLDPDAMESGEEPAADLVFGLFDQVEYDQGGVTLRTDRVT